MGDRLIFLNIFRIEKLRYLNRSFFFINIIELRLHYNLAISCLIANKASPTLVAVCNF